MSNRCTGKTNPGNDPVDIDAIFPAHLVDLIFLEHHQVCSTGEGSACGDDVVGSDGHLCRSSQALASGICGAGSRAQVADRNTGFRVQGIRSKVYGLGFTLKSDSLIHSEVKQLNLGALQATRLQATYHTRTANHKTYAHSQPHTIRAQPATYHTRTAQTTHSRVTKLSWIHSP